MTNIDDHLPGTPCWFDLMTPDLPASRAFYGAVFGWEFAVGPAEAGFYTRCQARGRDAAGMGQLPTGSPFPSAWTVYFAVEDCDTTAAALTAAGGTVLLPPMDVLDAGRMAVCGDPAGAAFGLWQPREHAGVGVVGEHGAMAWCEVYAPDAAAALGFYAALFGLEGKKLEPGPGTDYYTLQKGAPPFGGILHMNSDWAGVPPHWMLCVAVDDVDVAATAIAAGGGEVCHGPYDSPFGRIAVASDPAGAVFSAIQKPFGK